MTACKTHPIFPGNLENYAPWVAIHGLLAPYGECQCGCGQPTLRAKDNMPDRGRRKGDPARYLGGHHVGARTLEGAFWRFVERGAPDSCWIWRGNLRPNGYGYFAHKGRIYSAHRFSCELHHGPIPEGKEACHNCPDGDNRACVNPAHLWSGTHLENMADMRSKGRSVNAAGEKNNSAKLTWNKANLAREMYTAGTSQSKIAKMFGVDQASISRIVNNLAWVTER